MLHNSGKKFNFSFISFKKVKYYLIVNRLFFVEKGAQFRKKTRIEYHV